jgi:hypothetical protein
MYDATRDSIAFASCSGALGFFISPASHSNDPTINPPPEWLRLARRVAYAVWTADSFVL